MPIGRYRKELKRSHTLRYVLKNRGTGQVLLVILFTLYLKDDVDEEGNIKPGVLEQANRPLELRDEESKNKHVKKGWGWWSGGDAAVNEEDEGEDAEDVEEESAPEEEAWGKAESEKVETKGIPHEATIDDDVD
jgi:hypothetical protein